MTRATLIIHGEDPITVEFNVESDEDKATIEILPGDVKIHTLKEPTVVST